MSTYSQKDHKLFSYVFCSKQIGNTKIEGSPLGSYARSDAMIQDQFLKLIVFPCFASTPTEVWPQIMVVHETGQDWFSGGRHSRGI